ncbi:porin [Sphingomonadaceae bacterium OTU29THOMA1]|nr:porin [Sphingomonadaceae bacterium OTU29THOMA1]
MRFTWWAVPLASGGLIAAYPAAARSAGSQDVAAVLRQQRVLIEQQAAVLAAQQTELAALRSKVEALAARREEPIASPQITAAVSAPPVAAALPSVAAPPAKSPPTQSAKAENRDLRVKIGGWVQFDALYFPEARPGELEDLLHPRLFSLDPAARGRDRIRLSARDTRINIDVARTTDIGDIRAVTEFDFFGNVVNNAQSQLNSYEPRLRHAYFEWTDRSGRLSVLAGQSWSTFANPSSYAVIYNPLPLGSVFVRQPQLRVTYRVASGMTVSAALENPQGDTAGASGGAMNEQFDSIPDIVLTGRLDRRWGSVQLGGLLRRIDETQPSGSATVWGVSGSGTILLPVLGATQKLRFQGTYGTAVGRYIGELGAGFDGISAVGRPLQVERVFAGNVSYEHFFAPWISGTLQGSNVHVDGPPDMSAQSINRVSAFAANVVLHPVDALDLALEHIRASRTDVGGGSASRRIVRFSGRYRF